MIITRSVARRISGIAIVLAASCGKPDAKPAAAAADSTTAGDMKGMNMGAATTKRIEFTAQQVQHGGVQWGPVVIAGASASAVVPGEVAPNEDRTTRLGAPARGRVVSVPVRPGDRVTVGQALVTLQSAEAGMAQSDVAKAAAELTSRRAEAQYAAAARARAERLLAIKAIPRQDYERAIADDERARATVSQAEAELRRAQTTADQLSAAGGASGEIVLRAPAAGVVLERLAVPGAVVDAGAPLVVVTEPTSLWLTVNAPEQMAALFHRGGRLRFTVPAFPADTFDARVEAVGAGLDPQTRTLQVRASIANTRGRLKPQMLANVVVEGAGSAPSAYVPEDAVQMLDGKPHVFLARPDGKGGAKIEAREVTLGARTNGRVAVIRGLAAGDVIVTAGAFAVKAELQKAAMPKMEM